MTEFGGMVSVEVKGGAEAALAVARRVKLFTRATSLGGTESLIEHRASVEGPESRGRACFGSRSGWRLGGPERGSRPGLGADTRR